MNNTLKQYFSNSKNRWHQLALFLLCLCMMVVSTPVYAQDGMIDHPIVKLRALDKVTARTVTFEATVGKTIKFGSLYVKPQTCRKAPPIEQPESAAFLQIWEVSTNDEAEWVFSGWMFASSPGLSSLDHPIYDVWVLDCLETKEGIAETEEAEEQRSDEGEIDDESTLITPEAQAQ